MVKQTKEQINQRKKLEKDKNIDDKLEQISKVRDNSPRQIDSLKRNGRKTKPKIVLQGKTRSSKYKSTNSDK